MTSFRDFLQCYNNKDVVPTLEAMQKMIEFYHEKGIDMLKIYYLLQQISVYTSQPTTIFTHSFQVIVTCLKIIGRYDR